MYDDSIHITKLNNMYYYCTSNRYPIDQFRNLCSPRVECGYIQFYRGRMLLNHMYLYSNRQVYRNTISVMRLCKPSKYIKLVIWVLLIGL